MGEVNSNVTRQRKKQQRVCSIKELEADIPRLEKRLFLDNKRLPEKEALFYLKAILKNFPKVSKLKFKKTDDIETVLVKVIEYINTAITLDGEFFYKYTIPKKAKNDNIDYTVFCFPMDIVFDLEDKVKPWFFEKLMAFLSEWARESVERNFNNCGYYWDDLILNIIHNEELDIEKKEYYTKINNQYQRLLKFKNWKLEIPNKILKYEQEIIDLLDYVLENHECGMPLYVMDDLSQYENEFHNLGMDNLDHTIQSFLHQSYDSKYLLIDGNSKEADDYQIKNSMLRNIDDRIGNCEIMRGLTVTEKYDINGFISDNQNVYDDYVKFIDNFYLVIDKIEKLCLKKSTKK